MRRRIFTMVIAIFAGWQLRAETNLLALPKAGDQQLSILSPTTLELTLITTKAPDSAVTSWDFVDNNFQLRLPATNEVVVTVNGKSIPIKTIGFKRRPVYAPVKERDLRIGNYLYLELAEAVKEGDPVKVEFPETGGRNAGEPSALQTTMDPLRYSPAIHVNQVGYVPNFPKQATIGYYLGSLGEMDIEATNFFVVDAASGQNVFEGRLKMSPDHGFNYSPKPYQGVFDADFSAFTNKGEYKIVVPGLGASFPFYIDDGAVMAFARAYALGLYEQRCGTSNSLPFTRFTHDACHTAPANVPVPEAQFTNTWHYLAIYGAQFNPDHPPQAAPWLTNETALRFPYIRKGRIDASGGHHDAGDYSKYTSNSAQLIHYLIFAVDSFPGVAGLDNLGVPESGDGISDILQEAKWESDFLAKMQDSDGGFYFLVYPHDREYESNVTPDRGDPQVVWPKTTSSTAAAVAALAQCASSPLFKKTYPKAAADCLAKAKLGWKFLTNAIAKYGKNGAYQKITTYSDDFVDHDELAWAACEIFLATGDESAHRLLHEWFSNPTDPQTFRWGWWRDYACYGNAVRDYAFAARNGRLPADRLDAHYLALCENQIMAAGNDALKWSEDSAYGTSFPPATKAVRSAGWYFSSDQAFDITVACQLDPKPQYLDAILRNMNYEGGNNPVNVCYVTGLGWKRQHEIVDQYSQNDGRQLPKSGIPLGNVQGGFEYLWDYGSELGKLCFPQDGAGNAPYPFYDRWGDAYNTTTEFTILNLARGLTSLGFVAGLTPMKTQEWKTAAMQIAGLPAMVGVGAKLTVGIQALAWPGNRRELQPQIVWETPGNEPAFGTNFTFVAKGYGTNWIEAEAVWPDGRRLFAQTNFFVTNNLPGVTITADTKEISISKHTPVTLTFTRTGNAGGELTVDFLLGGTAVKWSDYRASTGSMPVAVTVPSGKSSETLTVYGVDNSTGADPETMTVTVASATNYNVGSPDSVTVKILR